MAGLVVARRGRLGAAGQGAAGRGSGRRGRAGHGWARRGWAGMGSYRKRKKAHHMTLREALEDIRQRHTVLTPALVVQEARAAKTEAGWLLHERLEWRDNRAAEAYRLQQARELIRSVRVVYAEATETQSERSVRAFHSVGDADGYRFEPVQQVVEDPLVRQIVLRDMEREWKALHRRWAEFEEFTQVVTQTLKVA